MDPEGETSQGTVVIEFSHQKVSIGTSFGFEKEFTPHLEDQVRITTRLARGQVVVYRTQGHVDAAIVELQRILAAHEHVDLEVVIVNSESEEFRRDKKALLVGVILSKNLLRVEDYRIEFRGSEPDHDDACCLLDFMYMVGPKELEFRVYRDGQLMPDGKIRMMEWKAEKKLTIQFSLDRERKEEEGTTCRLNYEEGLKYLEPDWRITQESKMNLHYSRMSSLQPFYEESEISLLKLVVQPRTVTTTVMFKNKKGFKKKFVRMNKDVQISVEFLPSGEEATKPVCYEQRYVEAAADDLKWLVDSLKWDGWVKQLEVVVKNRELMWDDPLDFILDKTMFLKRTKLILHQRRLKVRKFVMEYSGAAEDEDEVMTFLPHLELHGEMELHFRPTKDTEFNELELVEVSKLEQWRRARKLLIHRPFWIDLTVEKWRHFETIQVVVWEMEANVVRRIIEKARQTSSFISCQIETCSSNSSLIDYLYTHFHAESPNEYLDSNGFHVVVEPNKCIITGPKTGHPRLFPDIFIEVRSRRALFREIYATGGGVETECLRTDSGCAVITRQVRDGQVVEPGSVELVEKNHVQAMLDKSRIGHAFWYSLTFGTFEVAIGASDDCDVEFTTLKADFFKTIVELFNLRKKGTKKDIWTTKHYIKVHKLYIEYSGYERDELDFLTFLKNVMLCGERKLVLRSSVGGIEDVVPVLRTLFLRKGADLRAARQWFAAKKITVRKPVWSGKWQWVESEEDAKSVLGVIKASDLDGIMKDALKSKSFLSNLPFARTLSRHKRLVKLLQKRFEKKSTTVIINDKDGYKCIIDENVRVYKAPASII